MYQINIQIHTSNANFATAVSGLGAMLVMSVQTGIRRSDPMRSKASTIIHILAITYYGMIANDYVKSFRIGAKSYGETREADTAPEPEARTGYI